MEPLAFNTAAPGSNPMFATTRGLDRNPEFSSQPWFSTPKLPRLNRGGVGGRTSRTNGTTMAGGPPRSPQASLESRSWGPATEYEVHPRSPHFQSDRNSGKSDIPSSSPPAEDPPRARCTLCKHTKQANRRDLPYRWGGVLEPQLAER